jgi:hypothetical protein
MLGGMTQHDIGIRRVTVEDAAKLLGLSENAIRKRVERGSLASERADGTRYVLLDTDMPRRDTDMSSEAHTLISEMRSRIEFLEDELRRKDTILMSLVNKVPALEASPEARESSVPPSETPPSSSTPPDQERRSWLARFFGLQ